MKFAEVERSRARLPVCYKNTPWSGLILYSEKVGAHSLARSFTTLLDKKSREVWVYSLIISNRSHAAFMGVADKKTRGKNVISNDPSAIIRLVKTD